MIVAELEPMTAMVVANDGSVEDDSALVEIFVLEGAVSLVPVRELTPVESSTGTEAVEVDESSVVVAPVERGIELDTLDPADALRVVVVGKLSDADCTADESVADTNSLVLVELSVVDCTGDDWPAKESDAEDGLADVDAELP